MDDACLRDTLSCPANRTYFDFCLEGYSCHLADTHGQNPPNYVGVRQTILTSHGAKFHKQVMIDG
jgi:hypothetical protein